MKRAIGKRDKSIRLKHGKSKSNARNSGKEKLGRQNSGKKRQDTCIDEQEPNTEELQQLVSQLEQLVKVSQLQQLITARKNEIEYIRNELLNKAVDAGRAQLAAMILHNIGNAITPVAVYTEKLKVRNGTETINYLQKCYNDLMGHKEHLTEYIAEDPRGIDIIKYMGALIENIATENVKTTDIIDKIATGVDYVAQILTLQRAYAPGKTEMREKLNINSLVKDALKMQEFSISKRNITLETNLMPTIPHILMEKNKLMQVIVNLIKNSCDAIDENMGQKNHRLEITTYCTDKNIYDSGVITGHTTKIISTQKSIGVKIKDTGIGVEQERQGEIFDFGISSKGSSGFGLYYCKSFVEANKGTLLLESEGRGYGSTVTMELPYPTPQE